MFLSIIIPTYNPRNYLPALLDSISHNECANDVEVIISDDCSTEPFDDVLESYKHLNIKCIKNDKHYGFPRTGRQNGADVAIGEWITFADQDDYFLDNGLDNIQKHIKNEGIHNFLATNFVIEFVDTKEKFICDKSKGWTHGKFYQKSFWNEHKLCYDDVQYCEDINLSVKLSCLLVAKNITTYELDEPVYVWKKREDSLSSDQYFVDSMPDYIKGTLGVIIQYLERFKYDEDKLGTFGIEFLNTLLHFYFYFQTDLLYPRKKKVLEDICLIQPIYTRFKELLGFSNEKVIEIVYTQMSSTFNKTRNEDFNQIPFIEHISFEDWIRLYFE
jgi:glycosyltransferase involved in cell wall biosynthesis